MASLADSQDQGWVNPAGAVPLSTLLNGGSLRVDDKVFFDWTLVNLAVTDPDREPDLGLIEVKPLVDKPLNPGIRFEANGQLVVTDLNFLDLDFKFRARTLISDLRIKDNSLEIVAFEFGGAGGVIAILESVFSTGNLALAEKFVQADQRSEIFDLFDSKAFAPQREILVEKDIFLAGASSSGRHSRVRARPKDKRQLDGRLGELDKSPSGVLHTYTVSNLEDLDRFLRDIGNNPSILIDPL